VERAIWVVDIVRRWDWDVSFSLPFLDIEGGGRGRGGGRGFSSGCGLCDGGTGGGGGRRGLGGLDDSVCALEVEVDASRPGNAGGNIRLKVASVDACLWWF
jgi:hypothetical protein